MQFNSVRRRRVLTDEILTPAPDKPRLKIAGSEGGSLGPSERYTPAARPENQPYITDLVPSRYLAIVLNLMCGLVIVLGLEIAHTWTPQLASFAGSEVIGPLDLSAVGSIAHWFGSLIWSICAALAIMIYTLRRHRVDDYRGRYRIWLLASAVAILCSVHETASLTLLGENLVSLLTHRWWLSAVAWWWWVSLVALGAVAIRLGFEMQGCRLACVSLALAAVSLVGASLLHRNWLWHGQETSRVMLGAGALMVGDLLTFTSLSLYARYILLDASGLLPAMSVRPKRRRKAARATKSAPADAAKPDNAKTPGHLRTDLEPAAQGPARAPTSPAKLQASGGKQSEELAKPLPASRPTIPFGTASSASARTVSPGAATSPAKPAPAARGQTSSAPSSGDRGTGSDAGNSLSRAERKKLRRELKRTRRDNHDDEEL